MTDAVAVEEDDRAPEAAGDDAVPAPEPPGWLRRRDPVRWTLGAMVSVWALVFIVLGWERHTRFGTFGFDLGVYDQAVWLLGQLKSPFITIRGLPLFGFHMNVVLLLLAPFYRFGAGPEFLLLVQVAAQASGAVALFLVARDRLADRWLAVAVASLLLLHPTYQFLVWEYFHPDTLIVAPLLFAYWAARARRWGWYTLAALLAASCKEDAALALAVLGVLIAARGNRRIGAATSVFALGWFVLVTRVVLPAVNGVEAFYDTFFGDFGKTPFEVVRTVVTKPGKAYRTATLPDRLNYYRMMFSPVMFLPLAAIPTLMIAVPMLGINILSTFPYQRQIRWHYSAIVLAGIMLATVEAIAQLCRSQGMRRFAVALVVTTSVGATVAWGASPVSTQFRSGIWPLGPDARRQTKQEALAMIPPRSPVSAAYYMAPHLTRRVKVYEFPVPWQPTNWGVSGENLDNPAGVRWLILDRTLLSPADLELLTRLTQREFEVRFDRDDILVAHRVHPPEPGLRP